MRKIAFAVAAVLSVSGFARAEPFNEVTIGVPVPSLPEAQAWYAKLLGPDVETAHPVPGIVEFKVAPGVWLQLFEKTGTGAENSIVRVSVNDFAAAQMARKEAGIDTGKAETIPGVVTYSEFRDPYGNPLGLYSVP